MFKKIGSQELQQSDSEIERIDEKENNTNIVNANLSEEDFELATKNLYNSREQVIPNLQEKSVELTGEQKELLDLVDSVVDKILLKYGIDLTDREFKAKDIIPIKREDMIEFFGNHKTLEDSPKVNGAFIPVLDKAFIWYKKTWESRNNNHEFVHTVCHELMHQKSFLELQIYKKGKNPEVEVLKSGFEVRKLNNPKQKIFSDLNEAVTENFAVEVTNETLKKMYEIEEKTLISGEISEAEKVHEFPFDMYEDQCDALSNIIEYIVKDLHVDEEVIKAIFYRSYFSGDDKEIRTMLGDNFMEILEKKLSVKKVNNFLKLKIKKITSHQSDINAT